MEKKKKKNLDFDHHIYHKACFSDLAITQQTDLQGDQIGIRVIPTTSRGGLIQSHACGLN
jgi:hypothetical protein